LKFTAEDAKDAEEFTERQSQNQKEKLYGAQPPSAATEESLRVNKILIN